jgi:hypothetical protein
MDGMIALFMGLIGLLVFSIAALQFGVDSRPTVGRTGAKDES